MITLKANGKKIKFTTTKFPDGTTQAWKFDDYLKSYSYFKINFIWENDESEITQLMQIIDLIKYSSKYEEPESYIYLNIPYLPFARQDKTFNEYSTFALKSFANTLNSRKIDVIVSFDVHSKVAANCIKNFHSISPAEFHNVVYSKFKPDVVFYPDMGASLRYSLADNEVLLYGSKVRNQDTGEITGYRIVNNFRFELQDKKVLIIDDICDGGATFVTAAKALKELGVKEIGLCVSHGLFSKGFDEMKAAGISEFFTTNSLLKNEDGYKVYE